MRYGVPYQGSKNKIAEWVIDNLPEDEILVDLFAGGCAVTHAAMLSGKWDRIVANDAPAGCVEIASIKKQSLFAQKNKDEMRTEKLFVQERFYNEYLQKKGRLF